MTLLQITSTNNVTEGSTTVQTSSLFNQAQTSGEFIQYDIDLSSHGYNNNVTFQVSYIQIKFIAYFIAQDNLFQIQAVSSCGKLSETFPVTGSCISPMKPPTAEAPPPSSSFSESTIGIIVAGVAVLAILLILALFFLSKTRYFFCQASIQQMFVVDTLLRNFKTPVVNSVHCRVTHKRFCSATTSALLELYYHQLNN